MACTCLALPLLAACNSPQARPADTGAAPAAAGSDNVQVLSVGTSVYVPDAGRAADPGLEAACKAWKLDREGVARFFGASREYPDGTGDAFYALPCTISGQLQADGKTWSYAINAAATATWTRGNVVRTFGCSASACTPLVLMMPDNNSGQ
ncbi:hypothetical protein EYC45_15950 [Pseudoxanthomonas winnipegensis]|nr:hypothetical protein EYC45_15950 [Pseudoxanthomonas winnipegensis]